jgi:threonine/homoserine/homoserine lactone efflux protein
MLSSLLGSSSGREGKDSTSLASWRARSSLEPVCNAYALSLLNLKQIAFLVPFLSTFSHSDPLSGIRIVA